MQATATARAGRHAPAVVWKHFLKRAVAEKF